MARGCRPETEDYLFMSMMQAIDNTNKPEPPDDPDGDGGLPMPVVLNDGLLF